MVWDNAVFLGFRLPENRFMAFRQLFCGFFITLQKRELGISNCKCANKPALSPCGRELERGFVEVYPLPSPLPQGEGEKLLK
ncbi:hypothetical protein [Alysiella filiformis]|uniref:hypothetical protein n=1 Tax=Alysiella filiformis TaxID=194196 RepID=UPI000BE49131|nr:hypothetical protein [Alysiella filiformis]